MPRRSTRRPLGLEVSSLLVPEPSGIAVFMRRVIEHLVELEGAENIQLLCRSSRLGQAHHCPFPDLPLRGYRTGWSLGRSLSLLHCLDTRLPRAYRGPLVATLYDLISALPISEELELSSPRFRARKRRQYARIARRADRVVTISEETRRRFLEHHDFTGEIHVAPPGVERRFFVNELEPEVLERHGLAPGEYLIAVGELCPRKNLRAAVRAFEELGERARGLTLAVVGRPSFGWEGSDLQERLARSPGGVKLLGFVDDGDLPHLYAGSRGLVFLSHYEGFGLPVLEALAAGTAVVASRVGGIPEAAGEVAELVDPDDAGEVLEALTRIVTEQPASRKERIRQGREWAAGFTWRRCASRIVEAHRGVLEEAKIRVSGRGFW